MLENSVLAAKLACQGRQLVHFTLSEEVGRLVGLVATYIA